MDAVPTHQELAERLVKIGEELFLLLTAIGKSESGLRDLQQRSSERKAALTPEGGWPGSNDDKRKAARDLAYAADDDLQQLGKEEYALELALIDERARVQALEAQRRGLEYAVRCHTNSLFELSQTKLQQALVIPAQTHTVTASASYPAQQVQPPATASAPTGGVPKRTRQEQRSEDALPAPTNFGSQPREVGSKEADLLKQLGF